MGAVNQAFEHSGRIDFAAVSHAARGALTSLVQDWLPDGRREGSEWISRNPTRGDTRPGSFKINLSTGVWSDFATGEAGGDAIDLLAYLNRTSKLDAAREIAQRLGVTGGTASILRTAPVLSQGAGDEQAQKNRLGAMLDILLSSKRELFGITDERWNFSIYLWSDASKELVCFACRRRDRADEEATHRAWPAGAGQIGVCFQSQRELVVGDVQMPEFKAYFHAPAPLSRSDDAERYRSIAAVPISMNGGVPHGVVIATSDVPGRFVPSDARVNDVWDTVEPLRVLAGVLVILLSATGLHLRLGDQK